MSPSGSSRSDRAATAARRPSRRSVAPGAHGGGGAAWLLAVGSSPRRRRVLLLLPLAKRAVNALGLPLQYSAVIRQQAAEKHLDPALVAAVIYAETKFDPRTSSAGAVGLMQLMPADGEFLAKRYGATTFTTADLSTPQVNIAYGSYYLRYLLDEYHGSTVLALAAYNGGETNVDDWLAAARARGKRFTSADIRFPETRAYVDRVLKARATTATPTPPSSATPRKRADRPISRRPASPSPAASPPPARVAPAGPRRPRRPASPPPTRVVLRTLAFWVRGLDPTRQSSRVATRQPVWFPEPWRWAFEGWT